MVWRLFPLFTALVLASSGLGIAGASYFLYSKQKVIETKTLRAKGSSSAIDLQIYALESDSDWGLLTFAWMSGFETLFFGLAQIVMLKRLMDHVKISLPNMVESVDGEGVSNAKGLSLKKVLYLERFFYVMSALVICSGISCVAASISAAKAFETLRQLLSEIIQATDQNGEDASATQALVQRHNDYITDTNFALAQFVLSKAVVLILVVCLYLIVGPFCLQILRKAEQHIQASLTRLKCLEQAPSSADEPGVFSSALDKAVGILESPLQAAIQQRWRLLFAFNLCFWTNFPRLVHDIMYLIGNWNSVRSLDCGSCGYCQSFNWLMSEWLWLTPEFQVVTFAISSTLPLALSLLLLISDREKRVLRCGNSAGESNSAIEAKKIRDRFKISFVNSD
jgi:hypothetical protein